MKMLFSSSDGSRVDHLKRKLTDAGIACETRLEEAATPGDLPGYPALWVRDDKNFLVALMLLSTCFRQQGVARHSARAA